MSLNLGNLKNNKDEILKAEIGALLFNLGKTHIGFWHQKDDKNYWKSHFGINDKESFNQQFKNNYGYEVFGNYKNYFVSNNKTPFEIDLKKTDPTDNLSKFFETKVKLFDKNGNNNEIEIIEIMKGDISKEDFIKKIFFRGCENINSGIDKGSPIKQLDSLWISNAFGAHKRDIKESNFDKSRLCFFQSLHRFLEDEHHKNPNWQDIRDWVFKEINSWYSRLLSDSRFPINDVTLWDQAYMSASMFKATLSAMFLDNSKVSNYLNTPQSIKWSILGIQYDKLSLAEKGLKAASIRWYRDKSNEIDNEIKRVIEIDYVLGNEVYRDETGIYFIVPENIIGDKNADFYELHKDLEELKKDIQKIFLDKLEREVFPAIFLTEPSRGLMNLEHLIKKAKENFLKAKIPSKFDKKLKDDEEPNGICNICKMRLAKKGNKENLICDVCEKRQNGRIDDWIKKCDNQETIWLDELQDKNGRIALITLKFELGEWLNGNLVNSLLIQNEDFKQELKGIQAFILLFLSKMPIELDKNIDSQTNSLREQVKKETDGEKKELLKQKIRQLSGLKTKLEKIEKIIADIRNSQWHLKSLSSDIGIPGYTGQDIEAIYKTLIKHYNTVKNKRNIKEIDDLSFFPICLSPDAYNGCKKNNETFDDYIRQIFFGSIIGNEWEKLVKNHSLNSKILWEEEKIEWEKLTYTDIEFLAQLLLQFLLRKNPSPARLKRIWDTTREFFEELESKIVELAEIKKERQKRLVWNNIDLKDGAYRYGDILFWAKNKTLYLITSIEKIGNKQTFNLKKSDDKNSKIPPIERKNAKEYPYKPFFTILEPTPISWQFIIPAENVPNLIKNIKKEYYKNFKWVYGKLPLHIGVVAQNYKRPLYVGIKALRNIRRDNVNWDELRTEIDTKSLKARQKTAFSYQELPEKNSECEKFYSLFEKIDSKGKYEFYLYPKNEKAWLDAAQNATDTDRFYFYPNTFDFEFLDTNTRRNDIFYKNAKRFLRLKQQRPYDLYDWQHFEEFKNFFDNEKSSSKLQKLISVIYSKLEDWQDNQEAIKTFMISSFINILELKDRKEKDSFAKILGTNSFDEFDNMKEDEFQKKLYMLLDMFDLWHTILKEV